MRGIWLRDCIQYIIWGSDLVWWVINIGFIYIQGVEIWLYIVYDYLILYVKFVLLQGCLVNFKLGFYFKYYLFIFSNVIKCLQLKGVEVRDLIVFKVQVIGFNSFV